MDVRGIATGERPRRGAPGERRKRETLRISGRIGEAAAALVEAKRLAGARPLLFVAAGERRAADLVRALEGLAPDLCALPFPAWDCLPYDRASPSADIMGRRIATLDVLARGSDETHAVVTTPGASFATSWRMRKGVSARCAAALTVVTIRRGLSGLDWSAWCVASRSAITRSVGEARS